MIHYESKLQFSGADKKTKNENYYKFDLALITLKKPFAKAIPICVENDFDTDVKGEKKITTSGWEFLNKEWPQNLLYQRLTVIDEKTCSCESPANSRIVDRFLETCNLQLECKRPKKPKHYFCINKAMARTLNSNKVS